MKPKLPPGLYQLRTKRTYDAKELKVIKHGGVWCVVVKEVAKVKR